MLRLGLVLFLTVGAPSPERAEPWQWPVDGARPVRLFDPPGRPWLPGHRGADLSARAGGHVRAAGPGRVAYAGRVAGRGVVTVVHAGGLKTTYMPVRPSVRAGQPVRAGEVVGRLENRPGHCPRSCLHWGLKRGATYLDPLALLGYGRVRLLPHWGASPEPAHSPAAEKSEKGERTRAHGAMPVAATAAVGGGGGALLLTALAAAWLVRRRRRDHEKPRRGGVPGDSC